MLVLVLQRFYCHRLSRYVYPGETYFAMNRQHGSDLIFLKLARETRQTKNHAVA